MNNKCNDLTFCQIKQLSDFNLKKEYEDLYHFYLYNISGPICEYLENNDFKFKYSKEEWYLPVKEMSSELITFCNQNGIDRAKRLEIINAKVVEREIASKKKK